MAARNVLKVALASKIILEEAVATTSSGSSSHEQTIDEECDPFASMLDMNDECLNNDVHGIPTASTTNDANLDRIVQCAEHGDCPVGEITDMIEGKVCTAIVTLYNRTNDSSSQFTWSSLCQRTTVPYGFL